jgi:hypothetical protein
MQLMVLASTRGVAAKEQLVQELNNTQACAGRQFCYRGYLHHRFWANGFLVSSTAKLLEVLAAAREGAEEVGVGVSK